MSEIYICGLSDRAEMWGAKPWVKRDLTWHVEGPLPGFELFQTKRAIELALHGISKHCQLTFAEAETGTADVTMQMRRIDGDSGTLAWSEVSNGSDRPLTQRYDSERWEIQLPPSRRLINFIAVCRHEWMHALGFLHIPFNPREGRRLMNPSYDHDIWELQESEIPGLQDWYGKPSGGNQPEPEPGNGKGRVIQILIPEGIDYKIETAQ